MPEQLPEDQPAALPAPVRDHASDTLPVSPRDIVLSYYFSQGSVGLQAAIFHWMHARDPALTMTNAQAEALFQFCQRPVHANVQNPALHRSVVSSTDVDNELRKEIYALQSILNGQSESSTADGLIERIGRTVISLDWMHLLGPAGRRREPPAPGARYNPHADAYLSQLCYYALADNPTGSPLYDELFDGVREYTLHLSPDDPLYSKVIDVKSAYDLTHLQETPSGD